MKGLFKIQAKLKLLPLAVTILTLISCTEQRIQEINIGYIGPLSTRATDLGIGPANAMRLAVEQYNENKPNHAPTVNFFEEDDQWEKEQAIPAYEKLRNEHNIDVLFISNTDGTVAVQDRILEDEVILINPLNSDSLLSSLNKNTFKIAKSTEEANGLIAVRIVELGLKKVAIYHYPNDFMTRTSRAVQAILNTAQVENKIITTSKGETDYIDLLSQQHNEGYDAYVFFGYKDFGFAMKQAREIGISAPFFGSTVLLDPEFYDNSEGALLGTECTFFTPADGNYVLAQEFLTDYRLRYGKNPDSVWPPMQAYDAMNICLMQLAQVNNDKEKVDSIEDWLRRKLYRVRYHQGVCGNISITEDGASKGIYFSLYKYVAKGQLVKIK